jgi:hypothetical protein
MTSIAAPGGKFHETGEQGELLTVTKGMTGTSGLLMVAQATFS